METPNLLYPEARILLIDDDEGVLHSISTTLRIAGYSNVLPLKDGRLAMDLLKKDAFSCILLDLMMPLIPGKELLPQIVNAFPDIPVIVITAIDDLGTVVSCMRAGAHDYLSKPIPEARLLATLANALGAKSLKDENLALKHSLIGKKLKHPEVFEEIISEHPRMQSIFSYMEAIAGTPYPILITGESGTGKELIAKCLYNLGNFSGEFVAINAAGLDDTLFSDALFGHKKGAFTGAEQERDGLIKKAKDGVVFLDEIADMDTLSQIKMLRLFQDREFHPIGSDKVIKTNARFIVATNNNIEHAMKEGKFRSDLYYRLTTHHIHIPPLRERMSDLPILINHFMRKHTHGSLGKKMDFPPIVLEKLSRHNFPGNVRELENMIADAITRSKGKKKLEIKTFLLNSMKYQTLGNKNATHPTGLAGKVPKPIATLREVEEEYITSVIEYANNNIPLAAKILGINYSTLYRRQKKQRSKKEA